MHGRWYCLRDVAGALLVDQGPLSKIMSVRRRHLQYHLRPGRVLCLSINTKKYGSHGQSIWMQQELGRYNRLRQLQTSHHWGIKGQVCRTSCGFETTPVVECCVRQGHRLNKDCVAPSKWLWCQGVATKYMISVKLYQGVWKRKMFTACVQQFIPTGYDLPVGVGR